MSLGELKKHFNSLLNNCFSRSSSTLSCDFYVLFLEVLYSPALQVEDNRDDLKIKLKGILRDKSDVFNSKGGHEDKVKHRTHIIVSGILNFVDG